MFLKACFLILDIYSLLVSIGDKLNGQSESIQMEKSGKVSSDRNIRDHLWR